jgi:carbon starvation protein
MLLMIVLPAWAMIAQIMGWLQQDPVDWRLVGFGVLLELLQVWMIVEGLLMWNRAKGILPEPLPPLQTALRPAGGEARTAG